MSDDIKRDQDESNKLLDDKPVESRRRFTKAGLGGGAVLMSLLSRPALGSNYATAPGCSGSIMASVAAGTSLQHDISTCRFGCDVRFWCEDAPTIAWAKAGASTTTSFNSVFPCQEGGLTRGSGSYSGSPGLLEVLLEDFNETHIWFLNRAARQTVAAWLNAGILNSGADSFFERSQSEISSTYCALFDRWKRGDSGAKGALKAWGLEMKDLNSKSCPLSDYDDGNNMFYYPKW